VDREFTTERLVMRPYRDDDAEAAYEIYRLAEVTRWLGGTSAPVESVDAMRDRLASWAERNAALAPPYGLYAITDRSTAELIGTLLLLLLPPDETDTEIGWHLHPSNWGRGYATEAARALLARAFTAGVEQVYAVMLPGNAPSMDVAGRLGMEHVGRTDRYYGAELELFRRVRPPAL
jgi:[ribosomal protein S5]-alanine N-acetyltransferase